MSDFIHKTSFKIERSIHDPLRNTNPDYAIYDGHVFPSVSKIYWKWNDELNQVVEMTQEEKTAKDAGILADTPEPIPIYKTKNQIIHAIYGSFNPILSDVAYYHNEALGDYELALDEGWTDDALAAHTDQVELSIYINDVMGPIDRPIKVYKIYTARKDTQDELDLKQARKMRMIIALNKYPAFITMLDGDGTGPNYELAVEVLNMIKADDDLDFTQDDYDLVHTIIGTPV